MPPSWSGWKNFKSTNGNVQFLGLKSAYLLFSFEQLHVTEVLPLIKDQDRMLLFGGVQPDDGFGDLIDQIALEVSGLQIQIAGQLTQ